MKKSLILVAALAAATGLAQADTLKKIKDSGSVTMGVRESSGALSFTLGDGKFAGFHVEVCQRALADIQKALGMSKLDVKFVPVTSANRIPEGLFLISPSRSLPCPSGDHDWLTMPRRSSSATVSDCR